MTAKDYLSQARYLDGLIQSKREELQYLKYRSIMPSSISFNYTYSKNSSLPNKTEDYAIAIYDRENEFKKLINKLWDLHDDINNMINCIPNTLYRTILTYRYLNNMDWFSIQIKLNYCRDNLCKLHKKALLEFEKIYITQESTFKNI